MGRSLIRHDLTIGLGLEKQLFQLQWIIQEIIYRPEGLIKTPFTPFKRICRLKGICYWI